MTAWNRIPEDYKIPHDDMVLIRKPNGRGDGWNLALAYRSKGNGWLLAPDGSEGIHGYREWAEIPE